MGKRTLHELWEFFVHPVMLELSWLGLSVAGERHGQARFVPGLLGRKIVAAVRNVDLSYMVVWVSPHSVRS